MQLCGANAWLLSSLHSTPDKGAASRQLIRAILPHVRRRGADPNIFIYGIPEVDDPVNHESDSSLSDSNSNSDSDADSDPDGEENVPRIVRSKDRVTLAAAPNGLIFTRPIRMDERNRAPRLCRGNPGHDLDDQAYTFIFHDTKEGVFNEILQGSLSRPKHGNRIANKVKRQPNYHNHGQNPVGNTFNLVEHGGVMPPVLRGDVSDGEEEIATEPVESLDDFATRLLYTFYTSVTSSGPNPRSPSEPSYIRLTLGQRSEVNEETYMNRHLSDYFIDCVWRIATPKQWEDNFNQLFFPLGRIRTGQIQNYLGAPYHAMWEDFKVRADQLSYTLVRNALCTRIKKLYWLPQAQSTRIWYTSIDPPSLRDDCDPDKKWNKSSGLSPKKPAPRIWINGPAPTW
jgi:hypothetical protein